jgi:hypothetical protein
MKFAILVPLFIVVSTSVAIALHSTKYHTFNIPQAILAFFLVINVLICFWEICLSIHIDTIHNEYKLLLQKYSKTPVQAVSKLLFRDFSFYEIFTLKTWTIIWSTYSLYDPSYSNRETFGFFVDFGNGWTTLLPSLLFLYQMTFDAYSARFIGIIGMIKYYQECYGTVIYVLSYVYNKRYKGRDPLECILVVGIANSLWFFFPIYGMYLCYDMIMTDSFDVFRK